MKSLEDLERAFERGLNAWESDLVQKQAEQMGAKCVREVKRKTPHITGNLRRRWKSRVEREKTDMKIILEDDAEYAAAVNNGHRIVNGARETVGYREGRHMLEKGIASYKDTYMADDMEKLISVLRDGMKG